MKKRSYNRQTVNRVQRFINLCDQGKTPEQISEITGLSILRILSVMKTLNIEPEQDDEWPSLCGGNIIDMNTMAGTPKRNVSKPEPDTSQRKERKCNRSDCGRTFVSDHFGHRNCGCNYGASIDRQMEYA